MNDANFTHLVTKKVERILGREIEYATEYATHISKGECADCKKPAKYLIVEKNESLEDPYPRNTMMAWYYCGRCMVG